MRCMKKRTFQNVPLRNALHTIFLLTFSMERVIDRLLKANMKMTLAHFRMLVALRHKANISQQATADFWGLTQASTSRQIEQLRKEKMIIKVRNPKNQKEYLLSLSKRGRRETEKAILMIDKTFEHLFRDFPNKARLDLAQLLSHLSAVMCREINCK